MVLTIVSSLALSHGKHEKFLNEQLTMERKGRKTFLITRSLKSKILPAIVSVRELQRIDVLANFGPPGNQHGTPEEEDEVGSIVTSMEETVCLEWMRRRGIVVVVAHTL